MQKAKSNLEKWFKNGLKSSAKHITSHSAEIDGALRVAAQASGKIEGINVLEDFSLWFGTELGQGDERIQAASYITTMVVLEVAQDILNVGSAAYNIDMTALTLHQIKNTVERIEKKVDKFLKEPLETALSLFNDAITEVINNCYEEAFENLKEVILNAKKGLNLVKGKGISIESFGEYIKAARLIAFSTILRHSYQKKEKIFLPIFMLSADNEKVISDKLESVVNDCLEQKESVNVKTMFRVNEGKKTLVQDMLDSLLKVTYPYISQAKKWTDMNNDLSSSEEMKKVTLMPKYLPLGFEDKTELQFGFKIEKSIPDLFKVDVWKSRKNVWYEHKGVKYFKPIFSECDLVDMDDAESVVNILSATGRAREKWSSYPGWYSLTEEEYGGRPVYRKSEDRVMYSLNNGCWAVSTSVGDSLPVMRSNVEAPHPALCQNNWEYSANASGGSPWYFSGESGDVTVKNFNKNGKHHPVTDQNLKMK